MKKLFILLLVITSSLSCLAQSVGEVFYIYRNDGHLNAFISDEVESIEYSYRDTDGNLYDEIVTQIVNTVDSVYQIPIASIDSISFVTPETKYQPGVKVIEGTLRSFVISSDEMEIIFSSQIPKDLLPQIGDKLVTLEQSEIFPSGFLGEVSSVLPNSDGNYKVCCELADVRDVFKCYYGISYGTYSDNSFVRSCLTRVVDQGRNQFTFAPFRIALTDDWSAAIGLNNEGFAYKYSPNFIFEFTPTFHISAFMIRPDHEDHDLYISLTAYADFHFEERLGGSGSLEWSRDWGIVDPVTRRPRISRPIPQCPLITFYFEPGIFLRAASKISSEVNFSQDYRLIFHYDVSPLWGSQMQPNLQLDLLDTSLSGQISMNGTIALGGYAELGFLIADKRFAHICFRGEMGWELESNAVLMAEDVADAATSTTLYDNLREISLNVNRFSGTKIEGRLWALPLTVSYNLPLGIKERVTSIGHVPNFQNVSLDISESGSLEASAEVSGNLLTPVSVGFVLFDEEGRSEGPFFSETQYQNQPSILTYTFNNLKGNQKYTVYPTVRYNNIEMLASPSAELKTGELPYNIETGDIKIIDFSTVNAYGFIHTDDLNSISGHEYGICFTEKGSTDGWDYIPSNNIDKEGEFSTKLTHLNSQTEYIYCAYLELGKDDYLYGQEKSLKGIFYRGEDLTKLNNTEASQKSSNSWPDMFTIEFDLWSNYPMEFDKYWFVVNGVDQETELVSKEEFPDNQDKKYLLKCRTVIPSEKNSRIIKYELHWISCGEHFFSPFGPILDYPGVRIAEWGNPEVVETRSGNCIVTLHYKKTFDGDEILFSFPFFSQYGNAEKRGILRDGKIMTRDPSDDEETEPYYKSVSTYWDTRDEDFFEKADGSTHTYQAFAIVKGKMFTNNPISITFPKSERWK